MIEVGGTLVKDFQVKDEDGQPADAGTVEATVHWADGTSDAATVTDTGTGEYQVTFTPCTKAGWCRLEVTGSGANSSWSPTSFSFWVVDPDDLIVSLPDIKAALNVPAADTDKDDWLVSALNAAQEVIEAEAGAIVARTATFTGNGGRIAVLLPERAVSVTSVTVSGTAWAGFGADLDSGIVYADTYGQACFPAGISNVVVAYTTGAVDSAAARMATTELVRHWFQNGQQGSRPAFGGAAVEPGMPPSYAVPRRVLELLEPLKANRMPGLA